VQRDQLLQLYEVAVAADATTTDRETVVAAIAAVSKLEAWCDAQQIAYAQTLAKMGTRHLLNL
jgi:hypothetical protein